MGTVSKDKKGQTYYTQIKSAIKKLTFSVSEINKMLGLWESSQLAWGEVILEQAFSLDGGLISSNKITEYKKICLLNQIYGTRLSETSIFSLVEFLTKENERLNLEIKAGRPCIISEITKCTQDKGDNYCYSFATKYCSFAAPKEVKDQYPIFDNSLSLLYKSKLREEWREKPELANIKQSDLESWTKDDTCEKYCKYRQTVYFMRDWLSDRKKLTVKELDQYLWVAIRINMNKNKVGV